MLAIDYSVHNKMPAIIRVSFLYLLLILSSTNALGMTKWDKLATGLSYTEIPTNRLGGKLHAFKISPQHYQFIIDLAKTYNQQNLSIKAFVERNKAILGINGGFFSPNWEPLGLRLINKKPKSKFKNISWWGIAAFKNNQLKILSSAEYLAHPNFDYAVQCGPRLVINGKIPKLKAGIAERSAICVNRKKETLIIIANNHPVSINYFASILANTENDNGLGCINALNLDGGSSSQLYSQLNNKKLFLAGLSQITDALLIVPN